MVEMVCGKGAGRHRGLGDAVKWAVEQKNVESKARNCVRRWPGHAHGCRSDQEQWQELRRKTWVREALWEVRRWLREVGDGGTGFWHVLQRRWGFWKGREKKILQVTMSCWKNTCFSWYREAGGVGEKHSPLLRGPLEKQVWGLSQLSVNARSYKKLHLIAFQLH